MKIILYIASTLKRSGPTNQLYNLIKYLDRNQFEPHLVTLSPEPADSRWADFESLGVQLYTLGLSRIKGLFFSKWRLKSLVRQIRPSLIHSQGIRADMLNASALNDYPSLCTSRNDPLTDYPAKFGKIRGKLMAWQHVATFRKLNVVACSLSNQSQLRAYGIDACVIQNGVDTEKFQPADAAHKSASRQKLGLLDDARILLSVGSLIPRKDMQTLLFAYNKSTFGKTAQLIVLGDGPFMPRLKALADETVLLPGNVNNVAEYLQAADLFISTSLAEGLPNTVLEAMACELPCVLSDIPPHQELFGKDGLFFACGDTDALSGLLSSLGCSQLAEMGHFSRQMVEQKFCARIMSYGYQTKYIELMEGANG